MLEDASTPGPNLGEGGVRMTVFESFQLMFAFAGLIVLVLSFVVSVLSLILNKKTKTHP